jgi:hypothetical protein
MQPGDLFADRFEIERVAGAGGMGTVYRAFDRVAGAPVALKLVTREDRDAERFSQEARVLAELKHPAIVRYVAHGLTSGQPFLAMEWLDGEDLAKRLGRAGLTVAESLAVGRRLAAGLAAVHAQDAVHRDVKPSNVLLVGGDPARAKLLDFGIVRFLTGLSTTAPPITGTGVLLGTVGYMSPEQATADRALDARSDVFALGCVLFECLTGVPAFSGAQVVAVLAKILREEAPRVRALRPELPRELDDLVARMLAKDRTARPADGGEVLCALDAIGSLAGGAPAARARMSAGLSGGEQRLVSIMLARIPTDSVRVAEVVRRHSGDMARLANGVMLVTLGARGTTGGGDEAVSASACALALRHAFPGARIAVATGRAQSTGEGPPGLVIDRAAALLAQSQAPGVPIDEITASLLGERFEVRRGDAGLELVAQRSDVDAPRTLLGKPTPCVGRDKELLLLEGTLRQCIDESIARAVLVTGPAGQGKSRLRHEFVQQARAQGNARVLTASADPVGAGSAFAMVRQLVRRAAGLREGDPAPEQHEKLRAYVATACGGADFGRIADFLGELVGAPSPDNPSPQLRAARNDPQIMGEWLRRSFGEWLTAECAAQPLLLVLEDLHWGDLPSVTYLGDALRALVARPLMVLALARPEVSETFPALWAGTEMQEIPLSRLTPRAAERLVRAVLGDALAPDSVARIVQRGDGNAFYVEELIRRVAEGGSESLPETILALVQSRLERLEPEARRIVRAASVFGEVFWLGSVRALLGATSVDVDGWLQALTAREVFAAAPESRFPGEREYTFRHGLLREAAYAMLTEDDQRTGHSLAGEWLEQAGEKDALTMADHFERGGRPTLAVPWLLRAAQTAYDGGHVDAAIALGDRGVACGPNAQERGLLRLVQGQGLAMRGDWSGGVDAGRDAMDLLPTGSTPWFLGTAGAFMSGMFLGDKTITAPLLQAMLNVRVQPEPSGPYGIAVYCICHGLVLMGRRDLAWSFLERAETAGRGTIDPDPVFVLRVRATRGWLHLESAEIGKALDDLSQARALADRAGDAWGRVVAGTHSVRALAEIGAVELAEAEARDVLAFCKPIGHLTSVDWSVFYLAGARLHARRGGEAVAALRTLLDRRDPMLVAYARGLLTLALVIAGEAQAGRDEAAAVLDKEAYFPQVRAAALAALALTAWKEGRSDETLSFAQQGLSIGRGDRWVRSILHLARAEALHALGKLDEATVAIREARERVLRVAGTLDDATLRASYVGRTEANARTLELAAQWLGADPAMPSAP